MTVYLVGCAVSSEKDMLRIAWDDGMLTVASDRIPGGTVEIWYLEAFCRPGSTDREWEKTTIPFQTTLIDADAEGRWLRLHSDVDGKVAVVHELRAENDEVDFRMTLTNRTDQPVDVEWAQPCMRVDRFTGAGQDDYLRKCFIFTESGLTWMHETDRASEARYTPGQVYVPAGVDLNDVNPRPLSRTRPVNGLVGCVSADERLLLAMAWDQVQELFQGIIVCIHSDVRIGGLAPGATKRRRGKLYLMDNDPDRLLQRYQQDFERAAPLQP
jgi:hypothetical protein